MSHCEIVEMRNSADAVGSCSRTASTQCSDCGTELCESHTKSCSACHSVFCPSCFLFHQAQHSNPASASGHCSRPLFSLSHRAYTFGTVHSSTPPRKNS